MPATKHQNPDGTWRVETPNQVHAKSTTKKKAEAQVRIINAAEKGHTGKRPMSHRDFEGHQGYKNH